MQQLLFVLGASQDRDSGQKGFTLAELLIAMVISGIVMAAVIKLFSTEIKAHNTQFSTSNMQQNLRAAMDYMVRHTRMAGYDPAYAGAGFNGTLANRLDFTCDIGTLNDTSTANDQTPNGRIDDNWDEKVIFRLSGSSLMRDRPGGSAVTVAENIEALNFRYLDKNGVDTTNTRDVRSVQITLVGRTDPGTAIMTNYVDKQVYTNQRGDILLAAQNDHVRRMLLTAEVKCRNLAWQ